MAKREQPIDWEAIRQEWDVGQLNIREIARQHGIDHTAITKRAKRYGWPPRQERVEVVTDLVTSAIGGGDVVTPNPRIALTAFHRTMLLLLTHRRMLGTLADEIERDLADLAEWRSNLKGRRPKLDEIERSITIALRAAQAMNRLIPLQRRAFGINDADGPSEFDGLTQEQLDAIEQTFRKAIGG